MMSKRIWASWTETFNRGKEEYITPEDQLVIRESNMVDIGGCKTELCKAYRAWEHVVNNVSYKDGDRWKTPHETIQTGYGDCKGFTFLLASMFPNLGINESEIYVGELVFPNGEQEFHTWNNVSGDIIDGTGNPEDVNVLEYKPFSSWKVVA